MAQGPLGLPRPFAEEFESPLYMIVEIDREEHQVQFQDPDPDSIDTRALNQIVNNLTEMGIAVNKQTFSMALEPPNTLLFTLELAVTNINIQVLEDIRREVTGLLGYRNMVISTTPATAIERFR